MVEDESHFLITCLTYDDFKATLPSLAYVNGITESIKFSTIMSGVDIDIIHALAKFIIDAIKLKQASAIVN